MTLLARAKSCELHVHIGGCLYAEDVVRLATDDYREIDWQLFIGAYTEAFDAEPPDPVTLISAALSGNTDPWRQQFVVGGADGGDFARFQAKFNLAICVLRHLDARGRYDEALDLILHRHRSEGVEYVEYRSMHMRGTTDPDGFLNLHRRIARRIQAACGSGFEARYIPSLPRDRPLEGYALIRQLLRECPELAPTIVGLDFCFFEQGYPPRSTQPFFEQLRRDQEEDPAQALPVVYHVGEVFFDKSLESAVRWCHEAAVLGSRRLGHATALGMDPAVAVDRRPDGHRSELVSERLDQIAYDLEHAAGLSAAGVEIDAAGLEGEREQLRAAAADELVHRTYTPERLDQVRRRQDYVLDRLAAGGTVIETCPTSNLRIGAVPDPASHPVHRFLASDVNLVVGADDPGIFASPLATEVEWVLQHAGLSARELDARLGDPRRFALGRG